MNPLIPAILIIGGIILLFSDKKETSEDIDVSTTEQPPEQEEEEIIEAVYELLPEQEIEKPILSQITEVIEKIGATGPNDLEKIMSEFKGTEISTRNILAVLQVQEFLLWDENNPPLPQKSKPALPYKPIKKNISTFDVDDVHSRIKEWWKAKAETEQKYLPSAVTKGCGCKKKDGTSKKLFPTKEKADRVATYWGKINERKQETYSCPEGKGWHLRTIRKNIH